MTDEEAAAEMNVRVRSVFQLLAEQTGRRLTWTDLFYMYVAAGQEVCRGAMDREAR